MISYVQSPQEYFKNSREFFYVSIDFRSRYCYVNPLFLQRFSNISSNFTDSLFTSSINQEDHELYNKAIDACLIEAQNPAGKEPNITVELRMPAPGNPTCLVRWELSVLPNERGEAAYIQCIGVTIQNNHVEKSLRESRELYKVYIEQSSEAISRYELAIPVSVNCIESEIVTHIREHGYLAECNANMAKMFAFISPEELTGIKLTDLLDFNDPEYYSYLSLFIKNNFRISGAESHKKDRSGNRRYLINSFTGIVENGLLIRIWGTHLDITEKKLAEKKLLESEIRKAAILESALDAVIIIDVEDSIVEWNKAAETIFGFAQQEVMGRKMAELIIPERYREHHRKGLQHFIKTNVGPLLGKQIEITAIGKDGTEFPCELYIAVINIDGKIFFTGTLRDITTRKKSEKSLQESEKRFREVANSAPVMIWMTDTQNKTTYVNDSWINFTGVYINLDEQPTWKDLVHPEDVESATNKLDIGFRDREPVTVTYRLLNKSGEYRWVFDTGIPRLLEDGTFLGYIGSAIDINEQKIQEQQLRYHALLLENVSDVIVTTDLDFKIQSLNKIAEEFYGLKTNGVTGKYFSDVIRVKYEITGTNIIRHIEEHRSWKGEVSYLDNKGNTKYILNSITHVLDESGNKIGFMTVGRDITERKVVEERLRKSEQFYRSLIANSRDGMLIMNEKMKLIFASPSLKNLLGFEVEEVIGKNAFDYIHPEDRAAAIIPFQVETKQTENINSIVIRLLKKNGEWLWCMVRSYNLINNPDVNGVVIHFFDDTLRKQARDALKESEARFRNLISNLQLGIVLRNGLNQALICNKAAIELFDVREEDIIGKTMHEIGLEYIHEDNSVLNIEDHPCTVALRTKKPVRDMVIGVYRKNKKDWVWLLFSADPILDDNNEVKQVIASFVDISERKKLQQILIDEEINKHKLITKATIEGQEKERKEIGKELHDSIGQQLTTTKLYLDLAKSTADEATAEMVCLATKSVTDVINDVRTISYSLVPPSLGDLGLIESIKDLYESLNKVKFISIDFYHDSFREELLSDNLRLTLFRIFQEQMNNIVKYSEAKHIIINLDMELNTILLEISDDGKGFDPGKVKRGLGLMNISNRVQLFNGKALVKSSPGQGCTLAISIPLPVAVGGEQQ